MGALPPSPPSSPHLMRHGVRAEPHDNQGALEGVNGEGEGGGLCEPVAPEVVSENVFLRSTTAGGGEDTGRRICVDVNV